VRVRDFAVGTGDGGILIATNDGLLRDAIVRIVSKMKSTAFFGSHPRCRPHISHSNA